MPAINCQRCGEPFARAKLKGGPRQRYCSSRCRTATHRDTRPPAKQAKTPTENIGELGELRYTNGLQRRKATRVPQGTWGGIVAPRYVIQAAVIDSREWTDVISPDGVKSYVSQIGKRAPGRDGGIMSFGTPFAKGQGGRTRGVKNRLSHAFLQALADDFVAHGAEAIRICRVEKPNEYLRVIAHLMPRELEISHNPIEAISDDQLVTYIEHIRLQLEGRVERLAIRTDTEPDGEQVKLLPPI